MTKKEVMNLLDTIKEDVIVSEYNDKVYVTIDDFEGFDDDYNEIERTFVNDNVLDVIETIIESANEVVSNLYTLLSFEGFVVEIGYTSFDI